MICVSLCLVDDLLRRRFAEESLEAVERLPERLASLNLASDSRRIGFLVLSPEEMAMEHWQVAGWHPGRNVFQNPASNGRRLGFYPLSPLSREMECWELVGWAPERNVSPNLASDSRRLDDIPTPSKIVEEGWETCRWCRGENVSQNLASDSRQRRTSCVGPCPLLVPESSSLSPGL